MEIRAVISSKEPRHENEMNRTERGMVRALHFEKQLWSFF